MQHYFDTVYKINTTHNRNLNNKTLPVYQELEEMFLLYHTSAGGYDGWRKNDTTKKAVIISPKCYSNIALISNPKAVSIHKLVSYGAELVDSKYVFNDIIDASIQMAFVATKLGVDIKDIVEATNGVLNQNQYIKLSELFFDDFPEKFI